MNKEQREQLIDTLLIHLNDEVETTGHPIKCVRFNFEKAKNKWDQEYIDLLQTDDEGLRTILNACLSRGYLTRTHMTSLIDGIALTEEGQGRAISVDAASRKKQTNESPSGGIHIGTVNANGATQIGHGNIQNVEAVINTWVAQIEAADAPEEQKQEAKSLLARFIEHPLVNSFLGIGGSILAQSIGGK